MPTFVRHVMYLGVSSPSFSILHVHRSLISKNNTNSILCPVLILYTKVTLKTWIQNT